jgi:hypothetical protein
MSFKLSALTTSAGIFDKPYPQGAKRIIHLEDTRSTYISILNNAQQPKDVVMDALELSEQLSYPGRSFVGTLLRSGFRFSISRKASVTIGDINNVHHFGGVHKLQYALEDCLVRSLTDEGLENFFAYQRI